MKNKLLAALCRWTARILGAMLVVFVFAIAMGEGVPNPFTQPPVIQIGFLALAMITFLMDFIFGDKLWRTLCVPIKQAPKNMAAGLVLPLALLLAFAVAGCAHFENQTLENEPHAVIHLVKLRGYFSDYWAVSKIDGVPVRFHKTLRVRPGEHEVVVCLLETTPGSYTGLTAGAPLSDSRANVNMSSSGQMTVTGFQPLGGMQMANLNVESREVSYCTNKISVEAGWTYELDGYNLTKTQPCQ
jgi:hypothetical protein